MSEIEILTEFKTQLICFFDELISQFPLEGDLVLVRLFFSNQISIQDVMNFFNHKINTNDQELRKMVKEKNEAFFLEHNVFDNLGKEKINHFKKLWRSGLLDDEDKEVIWNWIDAFIYLGDKYTKVVMNK
jgi:hypothetical protein